MKVILDEQGVAMADVFVPHFIRSALARQVDVCTSQMLVITFLRAELLDIPVANRPYVEWVFYGKSVTFDNDLRSHDAFDDPRSRIDEDAMRRIIETKPYKEAKT